MVNVWARRPRWSCFEILSVLWEWIAKLLPQICCLLLIITVVQECPAAFHGNAPDQVTWSFSSTVRRCFYNERFWRTRGRSQQIPNIFSLMRCHAQVKRVPHQNLDCVELCQHWRVLMAAWMPLWDSLSSQKFSPSMVMHLWRLIWERDGKANDILRRIAKRFSISSAVHPLVSTRILLWRSS